MLSICTTIKNRSAVKVDDKILHLFPNCVSSIAHSLTWADAGKVELVIADWGSTDWPIKEWIESKFPYGGLTVHLVNVVSDSFSAGKGRNIAAEHAKGDVLFFLDADMKINNNALHRGWTFAAEGKAFYPIVKYEVEEGGKQIIHEGGGNLFISKENFEKTGGWPEYWSHGFEDTDFAQRVKKVTEIVTHSDTTIFHQWHPQTSLFKNAHVKEYDKTVDVRKDHYEAKRKSELDVFLGDINKELHSPHTTHSKLHRPVKGPVGPMRIDHV